MTITSTFALLSEFLDFLFKYNLCTVTVPLIALHKFDGCKRRRTVCKIDTKWRKRCHADNGVIHPRNLYP